MADGNKIRETDFVTNTGWGWPTILAFLAAIFVAVIFGLLIGLPALRIRGVQLAVVTIAAVVAVEGLLMRNPPLMGSGSVSVNPSPNPNWFGQYVGGFNPTTSRTDYWKFSLFLIIVAGLVGLGVANLRRGQIGRRHYSSMNALRSCGYQCSKYEIIRIWYLLSHRSYSWLLDCLQATGITS